MSKKWQLSRRTFLKGLGVSIGLPYLEAMMPRQARAEDFAIPRRLLAYYVPCGIVMNKWTPSTTGADYALTPILQPLAAFKGKFNVLSGINNYPASAQGDGAGDHARGTASFATAVHVNKSATDIRCGVSVDQLAAQMAGDKTLYRSLELGIEAGPDAGSCDSGYSCSYSHNISWADETTPVSKEIDPAAVFDRLFSGLDPHDSAIQAERRKLYKQSVLDFVMEDTRQLQNKLGAKDNEKLDEYLTGVREIETRLNSGPIEGCESGERPTTVYDIQTRIRQMSDLMALAFQCDLTRYISFMQADGGSNRTFPFLGITQGHHYLSHHDNDPDTLAKLEAINIWEMEMFAYLLGKLDAIQEVDGSTLLDHSAIMLSSEIEDGNSHSHNLMPVIMAGAAGGAFTPGRHIDYAGSQTFGNMYLSMLQAVGIPVTQFGDDGTQILPNLKV